MKQGLITNLSLVPSSIQSLRKSLNFHGYLPSIPYKGQLPLWKQALTVKRFDICIWYTWKTSELPSRLGSLIIKKKNNCVCCFMCSQMPFSEEWRTLRTLSAFYGIRQFTALSSDNRSLTFLAGFLLTSLLTVSE